MVPPSLFYNTFFSFTVDSENACTTLPEEAVPSPAPEPTPSPSPGPHPQFCDCNFNDHMCCWKLDHNSGSFWWKRLSIESCEGFGYNCPGHEHDGLFLYVSPEEGGIAGDSATISTEMGEEAKGCMYFYFNLYHGGGIRALKIRTQDPDGFLDYIWDLTDYTMESNEQWGTGQVNFNTHQLIIEATHADNTSTTGYAAIDGKLFDNIHVSKLFQLPLKMSSFN